MSAELGHERAGALELVRGVHVHERDRRVAKPGYLGLADLDHAHAVEEPHDLEPPGAQTFLDGRQARLAVGGVQGLELLADSRNDDIALTGARDDQPDDLRVQERHVARDRERNLAGGPETRIDAAERAVGRGYVGNHREPEKRIELRRVGDDQQVVDDGREGRDDTLDDRPATERDQVLRLPAQSLGLAPPSPPRQAPTPAPCRMIAGGSTVMSRTVEGAPPAVGPPSSTRSSPSPK